MTHTLMGQLVFSSEVASQLARVSADLAEFSSARFMLGAQTPPHITLFNRAMLLDRVAYASIENVETAVDFLGACQLGAGEGGMAWAAVKVSESGSLLKLRHDIMRQLDADGADGGDINFSPHVTVAHIHENDFAAAAKIINAHSIAQKAHVVCHFDVVVFSPETGYRRYRDGTLASP